MKDPDIVLLLVEDNDDDVFLMRRAFGKANLSVPLHVVTNGRQAMDYLAGKGEHSNREKHPFPSAVFLDLKLPYVHGFEVLKWMRNEDATRTIPVFVLTSSLEERDSNQAFQLGAQEYLVKPPSAEMLLTVVESLRNGTVFEKFSHRRHGDAVGTGR
jgi:CheY-like chemotaxis protein